MIKSSYIEKVIVQLSRVSGVKEAGLSFRHGHGPKGDLPVPDFIQELTLEGQKAGFTCVKNYLPLVDASAFLGQASFPVLLFREVAPGQLTPVFVYPDESAKVVGHDLSTDTEVDVDQLKAWLPGYVRETNHALREPEVQILFLSFLFIESVAEQAVKDGSPAQPSPMDRLIRLLAAEKKSISYIYIYAIIVGLITLTIPLGMQAIIGLISGGLVFSSVIVLIVFIICAVLASGALQIMQISLVEILQQRIFAKAAYEFAYRVPKIKTEALDGYHPPELMNRFFDVVNIQKSLPKLLVDLTGAVLQILFGLILVSFYHPFFLGFGLLLLAVVAAILYFTGPKGLKTSLYESKYKYKIAYWLEEVARTIHSFKATGDSNLHVQKMDDYVNQYLHYRKSHFSILRTQFSYIVLFKTFIIGGLLILGTLLVVDRQISLGQFVASEVIIVLVIGAVEKIIFTMDTIYDLLTAVEKIGQVTDLPLEKDKGAKVSLNQHPCGVEVKVKNLSYHSKHNQQVALRGMSFTVKAGEKVGFAGPRQSGKVLLARVLAGLTDTFEGSIQLNGISRRDLHQSTLRTSIDTNLLSNDLFEGTLLDNISMGRLRVSYDDIWWAIEKAGLGDFVNALSDGLQTWFGAEGMQPPPDIRHQIILARSLASRPKLLVLYDDWGDWPKDDRERVISGLMEPGMPWTLIVVSNDVQFLEKCDRVLIVHEGQVIAEGKFNELTSHPELREKVAQTY
jgi:ABC-type bacteriocin/lantibiotic exporter with double-glycine peptidase domain